eukprot:SAG31_NODE_3006_length_4794_cov_3.365495_10_plen_69_part_00
MNVRSGRVGQARAYRLHENVRLRWQEQQQSLEFRATFEWLDAMISSALLVFLEEAPGLCTCRNLPFAL